MISHTRLFGDQVRICLRKLDSFSGHWQQTRNIVLFWNPCNRKGWTEGWWLVSRGGMEHLGLGAERWGLCLHWVGTWAEGGWRNLLIGITSFNGMLVDQRPILSIWENHKEYITENYCVSWIEDSLVISRVKHRQTTENEIIENRIYHFIKEVVGKG